MCIESKLQDLAHRMTEEIDVLVRNHAQIDALESTMLDSGLPVVHLPVIHIFTPGLYARRVHMPAGTVLTSKGHDTEHPYVVLSGVALVAIPGKDPVRLEAGYVGVTEAGTRRVLKILEDCDWITFHPLSADEEEMRKRGVSEDELVAAIGSRIISNRNRADGRNIHAEYTERLRVHGLPGPNDGARLSE